MHSKEKIIHHDILMKPWDVIGADMYQLNNNKKASRFMAQLKTWHTY